MYNLDYIFLLYCVCLYVIQSGSLCIRLISTFHLKCIHLHFGLIVTYLNLCLYIVRIVYIEWKSISRILKIHLNVT